MLALSAVLLTFSYQLSLLFVNISHRSLCRNIAIVMAQGGANTAAYLWTISVNERCRTLAGKQRASQGKDYEVILTVKIQTRHSVRAPFGCDFSAFVIIAEL